LDNVYQLQKIKKLNINNKIRILDNYSPVEKSGPRSKQRAFILLGTFGLPPDMLINVNCSSGPNKTRAGPNMIL
jgi:hypothetical protein